MTNEELISAALLRAFPNNRVGEEHQSGISKVTYLAGCALSGMDSISLPGIDAKDFARRAIEIALATLKEIEDQINSLEKAEKKESPERIIQEVSTQNLPEDLYKKAFEESKKNWPMSNPFAPREPFLMGVVWLFEHLKKESAELADQDAGN